MYVYIHINFTSFPTYTTHQFAGWFCFFFPPRKVNGFTDPDGWRYARHFGKGALWRFGTFGEERVGYGRGNKKAHGLKGSLITFNFFSQKQIIFSSSSTAAFFLPRLAIPHKKYKTWHVGASNKLPWGPTKLTKEGFFCKLHLWAKLLMFWFWSPFLPS